MSLHDSTSSRDAGRRGRLRDARTSRHTGDSGDGILVLVPPEPPRDRSANSSDPMFDDAALAQLRAEHDAALEQIAFLEEQLRSAVAYHTHLYERERAHMHAEYQALLRELVMLGDELQRRARDEVSPAIAGPEGDGAADAAGSAPRR